jgi:hypothetical protein
MAGLDARSDSYIELLLDLSGRARVSDLSAMGPEQAASLLQAYASAHPEKGIAFDGDVLAPAPAAQPPVEAAPAPEPPPAATETAPWAVDLSAPTAPDPYATPAAPDYGPASPTPDTYAQPSAPEAPQIMPEAPQVMPEAPYGMPEAPQVMPEAPYGMPEAPQVMPEAPYGMPEAPQVIPAMPDGIPEAPPMPETSYGVPMPVVEIPTPAAVPEQPVEQPYAAPVEQPYAAPVEQPFGVPMEPTEQAPAEVPLSAPYDTPQPILDLDEPAGVPDASSSPWGEMPAQPAPGQPDAGWENPAEEPPSDFFELPPLEAAPSAQPVAWYWWLAVLGLGFPGALLAWFLNRGRPGAKSFLWVGIGLFVLFVVAVALLVMMPTLLKGLLPVTVPPVK